MTEKEPATSTAPANSNTNNTASAPGPNGPSNTENSRSSRGLPYYEKLRRELRDTIQKKRLMDKSMAQLEDQIYRFEQSYLEETTAGNIIKGFDNYIKGSAAGSGFNSAAGLSLGFGSAGGSVGGAPNTRRKGAVMETERVFSRSSASYLRDSPTPSSTRTTPSHANTPSSMSNGVGPGKANGGLDSGSGSAGPTKGGSSSKNKKKAAGGNKEEDIGDEDKPVKRLKITYSRD